jgi:hypothetical protein
MVMLRSFARLPNWVRAVTRQGLLLPWRGSSLSPVRENPMGCYGAEVRRLEFRSAPYPLTGLGAPSGPHGIDDYDSMPSVPRLGYRIPVSVPSYPIGKGVASGTTVPSIGEHFQCIDEYYGYTGDERRRPYSQGTIRVADLASLLYPTVDCRSSMKFSARKSGPRNLLVERSVAF